MRANQPPGRKCLPALSRRMISAVVLCTAAPAPVGTAAAKAPEARSATSGAISIATGGWGRTDESSLQMVLESVAAEFARHLPERPQPAIRVEPDHKGPIVLYRRGAGSEYLVRLSARDGRWYQFVYQFAHELCHIHSNFDRRHQGDGSVDSANQWFEESLCEAAALYTLRSLSRHWADESVDGVLRAAAPSLAAYAERFLSEPHRRLAPGESLQTWFEEQQDSLRHNPYQRGKDELIANRLLPLFERAPERWHAIAYLNRGKLQAIESFADYLAAWCDACPEESRAIVLEIIALFGASAPGATQATN